jgi:transcriptional regulator with XRE-family HTH domain
MNGTSNVGHTGPQSSGRYRLNNIVLYSILDTKRRNLGMSWREVARECGFAEAAFTRLKQGKSVSANTLLGMLMWIGFYNDMPPLRAFITDTKEAEH